MDIHNWGDLYCQSKIIYTLDNLTSSNYNLHKASTSNQIITTAIVNQPGGPPQKRRNIDKNLLTSLIANYY